MKKIMKCFMFSISLLFLLGSPTKYSSWPRFAFIPLNNFSPRVDIFYGWNIVQTGLKIWPSHYELNSQRKYSDLYFVGIPSMNEYQPKLNTRSITHCICLFCYLAVHFKIFSQTRQIVKKTMRRQLHSVQNIDHFMEVLNTNHEIVTIYFPIKKPHDIRY